MPSPVETLRLVNEMLAGNSNLDTLGAVVVPTGGTMDLNGIADALVLDADADTTISAPTDDQIDIEIAGADDFTFTANSFNVLTGSVVNFADAADAQFGSGDDAAIRWSTGDADNHALVVALGDSNQAVHITDLGAVATDWAVAADTHPTVYIHSNTTPATDYITIGAHDGTTAAVNVVGGTTLNLSIGGTASAHFDADGIGLADDVSVVLGSGSDAELLWSTADADNHSTVLALGDSNQALHITDLGAVATDWAVAADTHPTLYVHSNTTPATDYIRIGDHDGTEADVDVVGGTSMALKLAGTEYASVRVTGLAVGTYVAAATPGTDQVTIKSTGTVPAGTGANVGHLYADFETDDDELFWLSGTIGTATQLTT